MNLTHTDRQIDTATVWPGPIMSWETWADLADATPSFLIEGFVHNATNTLSGRPTVGKTRLVAAMVAAVTKGEREFCGQAVNAHGRALIVTTDPGEATRWGQRMREHGVPTDAVGIAQYNPSQWDWYIRAAAEARIMVFDNALGALGSGSVRDDDAARELTGKLTQIANAGASVILIAHSAKNFEDQTGRRAPTGAMGSTVYEAWSRNNIHVHDVTEPFARNVKIRSNDHADRNLTLTAKWGEASATWELTKESDDKRPRTDRTHQARQELFDTVAGNPELRTVESMAAIGRQLYDMDPAGFSSAEAAKQRFIRAKNAAGGAFIDGAWQRQR